MECWGQEYHDGWENPTYNPDGTWVDVDANYTVRCGVTTDGLADCVGAYTRISDVYGPYTKITNDNDYACGIEDDGQVSCWGNCSNYVCDVPP